MFLYIFVCHQQIWMDIGETESEKDRMLIELEIECLEVYRRKVDEAANTKVRLHQSVAAKEAELAALMASLGDLTIQSPPQLIDAKSSTDLIFAALIPFQSFQYSNTR
ncbi:putative microtubule-associated protein, MAP65/Ase1/PRC1 [Helianthus annuus]|nr:putative microtubule-associated protein, MAP65/Ase1/PRC1 [Helianthus annuus]KAJ0461121.1 putative microtubule-associated protein, MAP65/Ase1/PRC1 [Helianthus annuus]KAJ0641541.1 putative microtubule-associated protein, MAP65/Ase1/PRC1 [Helianthus annuus]KAJ0645434.1 putative microtubule-associated protein, MAP65/Ase1/PRC1 [Helianthus annuus]